MLGHRDVFLRGLNMTFEMFCNPRKYAAVIEYHLNAGMAANGGTVNIETLQKIMWQALEVPVATVLRPMFIVRAEGDPTKWSQGVEHASFAARCQHATECTPISPAAPNTPNWCWSAVITRT